MQEIVIKIPNSLYANLKKIKGDSIAGKRIIDCVINGTVLPKGHGDLIDRSEAIKSLFDYDKGKKTIGQCIDDVPKIIEADKENEE